VQVYVRSTAAEEGLIQWILRDITERKELDSLRDDLTAMIYHDLRSPLANIVSSLDILNSLLPPEEGQSFQPVFQIAMRSTERLQRLISSLLDINRLEAGQAVTQMNEVEPHRLVAEAVEALRPTLDGKQQTLNTDVESDLPAIQADTDMIRRVLINLLENATKFSPLGGSLGLSVSREGAYLRFSVADSGPGIPAESRDWIFEKFSRIKPEGTPKGFGLGLAFCKLAIQAHGGKIWVEDREPNGSRFVILLPIAAPTSRPAYGIHMQEISPHIYIETGYAGVTLGAINWPHGLILIDSPFRPEDTRSWRSALLNLGGGVDRMLVNLDASVDRTLGTRGMECTVVGHEKLLQVFRNRPVTFKPQSVETGSEWELHSNLGSIRWNPPEITYSEQMQVHWSTSPVVLESRPGPATGASWVVLPQQNIVFVGDAVVVGQPPFLAFADIPAWIESLQELLSPTYQNFLIVGGRNGLVTQNQAREQMEYLKEAHEKIEAIAQHKGSPEETSTLVPELLNRFHAPPGREEQYRSRVRFGLQQYYLRHYRPAAVVLEE
jgi:nitrogen-specific signal transduction histidine kinase/glyoxylase-like metal-dependent hydrolase (beta-lactamase superfamily II)